MKKIVDYYGPVRIYSPAEARREFAPLRDRIFCMEGGVSRTSERVFQDESWTRVIIRGALVNSNRTDLSFVPPIDEELLEWAKDDPRSELQPLLDLLIEDGVDLVTHMYPGGLNPANDAIATPLTYGAISAQYDGNYAARLQERLLFDGTG